MYNSGGEVYTLNDLGLSFPTTLIWGFPITYDNPPQSTYTKQLIEKRVGGAGKINTFSANLGDKEAWYGKEPCFFGTKIGYAKSLCFNQIKWDLVFQSSRRLPVGKK